MAENNTRVQWGSRIGFIMAAAGSAVGLGNIWRFPYLAGMNGGAAFVLVYFIIVMVIGFSVMIAELSLGRRSRLNALGTFRKLAGGSWVIVGWLSVAIPFFILSFYGVVAGWTIKYVLISFGSLMSDAAAGKAGDIFGAFIGDWKSVVFYQLIFMIITIVIVAMGIEKGIEKSCKFMMPLLYLILFILIVRGVTLPGGSAGLEFYLKPDLSKITGKTMLDAMGQAFFSLSLGMGIMLTYGSYLNKSERLPASAALVCTIDTSVAFLAGFAIFPGLFATGLEPAQGPGLAFISCPAVFATIPGGMFFSALFFILFFLAGLTSSISLLEVCCSYIIDELKWTRAKAAWVAGLLVTAVGVPSAMSLGGHIPTINFLGKDMSFMDIVEQVANNIGLPLVGILISLYVGWFWFKDAKTEITNDGDISFGLWTPWLWICRVIAPAAIAIVLVSAFW